MKKSEIPNAVNNIINDVGLSIKQDDLAKNLSGG